FPANAAHFSRARARESRTARLGARANAAAARQLPMGNLFAEPRRTHAGNGDAGRAQIFVGLLCARPTHAPQSRHSPPPRAVTAKQARKNSGRAFALAHA